MVASRTPAELKSRSQISNNSRNSSFVNALPRVGSSPLTAPTSDVRVYCSCEINPNRQHSFKIPRKAASIRFVVLGAYRSARTLRSARVCEYEREVQSSDFESRQPLEKSLAIVSKACDCPRREPEPNRLR